MAATKLALRRTLTILVLLTLLVLSYQNCAVDLARTTPGASVMSCNPTDQDLASFASVQNTYLIPITPLAGGKDACGACHGQNVNNSAKAVYLIWQGNPATDPTITKKNFCQAEVLGRQLVDHPMSGTHGGGQYSQTEIQALYDWARTNL